jgi:hypothetical protein
MMNKFIHQLLGRSIASSETKQEEQSFERSIR